VTSCGSPTRTGRAGTTRSSRRGRHSCAPACAATSPARTQIQAAINAVHSDAPSTAATDWGQIVALYDQLLAVTPTPVVALHRAVAVAEIAGPATALALVDELPLDSYHLFHATRADLLHRLGRDDEAAAAYESAITHTANAAEQDFLRRARAAL
jgi:RNA polymerase sigma-70 factor (ECF subfamily)